MQPELTPQQIDAIAEKLQNLRLQGKPHVTTETVQQVTTEPWRGLSDAGKNYLRATVKAAAQAFEANSFTINPAETGQGAGRSA